jgi:hypothetical protein
VGRAWGLFLEKEAVVMPFQQYSDFFQPKEIEAFTTAYNAARLQLWATGLTFPGDQDSVIKRKLRQMILASACKGERDAECLKEIALRGVSRKAQRKLEWARGGR